MNAFGATPRGPLIRGIHRCAVVGLAAVAATGAALASGMPSWATPNGEGSIRSTGSAVVIPDSYVVVFKDSSVRADAVDSTAGTLSARFGGKVSHRYHSAVRGFSVTGMSEEQAKRLAADPSVAYVQHDTVVRMQEAEMAKIQGTQTTQLTWNLDRIDQRNLPLDKSYTYPNTGSTVHAYIIDTGIRVTQVEFGGRASYGYNFLDNNTNADDNCNGHGSMTAGIVGGTNVGVAKAVQLVAVKVADCDGNAPTSAVAAGIDWVTTNAVKPAVINLSLGAPGTDPVVNDAVQRAISAGITVSIAAGNGLDDTGIGVDACGFSPAMVPQALTVAATDENDQRAGFSNYGSCVDLFAPGVDVISAFIDIKDPGDNSVYGIGDGTSFSAPHVAGAAALILAAHPDYTPAQVHDALVVGGTPNVVGNAGPNSPSSLVYVRNTEPPTMASKLAVIYNPRFGTTEVYARAANNHIVYSYWSGGWSDWFDLGGNAVGDPAVLYNPRFGTTEVYTRTADNKIAYRYYSNGWSGWNDLAGSVAGNPGIIFNPRFGTTEVYVRTTGNTLAYKYFSDGWSGWNDLQGDVASDPAVLYNPRFGTTEAYVRTSTNTLQYRYYSNGWSVWNNLEGSLDGSPSILFNPRFGTTEAYSRTQTNYSAYRYFSNGWSDWIGTSL